MTMMFRAFVVLYDDKIVSWGVGHFAPLKPTKGYDHDCFPDIPHDKEEVVRNQLEGAAECRLWIAKWKIHPEILCEKPY